MEGKNGDSRSSSPMGLRSEFRAARVAGTQRENDGEDLMRQLLFKLLADFSDEHTVRTPGNPAGNSSCEAKELNRFELLHNGEETEVQVPLRWRGFDRHPWLLLKTPEGPHSRSKSHAQ